MPALALRVKNIIKGKGEYAVLFRSAGYSMGIKCFSVAAAFAMNFFFARYLGSNGVGQFFLVFSVVNILSMIGKLGMDRTVLRYISAYASQNEWGKVKGVQFFAFRLVSVFTICTSLILFFLSSYIANYWFKQPELAPLFKWFAFGIVPLAIIQNTSESLKGLGKVQLAQMLYDALLPALATFIFFAWRSKTSLNSVYSYLIASAVVFFVTQAAWRLSISKHKEIRESIDKKEIMRSAIPVFWANIFQQIILWMPAFMLGLWASTKDVGLFQVAFRVAQLIALFQYVFTSNLAPRISALYVSGQIKKIQDMCGKTTLFVGILAMPFFIAITFFPNFFIGLFGSDFKSGGMLLAIMAVGQFYSVIMGPVGVSLIMCGREKKLRNSMIISSCSLLVLNAIFIPMWGALGAAITSCLVTIMLNTLQAIFLWKELHIFTLPKLRK